MKNIVKIRLRGHDVALLDATAKKIVELGQKEGGQVSGPVPLPTKKKIYTILRATHKYGYAQEQFEKRTHHRLIQLIEPSKKTIDMLNHMEMSAGIDIKIKL